MLILKLCSRQEISSSWFLVSWFLIFRSDLSSAYNKLTNIQMQGRRLHPDLPGGLRYQGGAETTLHSMPVTTSKLLTPCQNLDFPLLPKWKHHYKVKQISFFVFMYIWMLPFQSTPFCALVLVWVYKDIVLYPLDSYRNCQISLVTIYHLHSDLLVFCLMIPLQNMSMVPTKH